MQSDKEQVVCFDVDDTLVMWGFTPSESSVTFNNYGFPQNLEPHKVHIEALKAHKAKGDFVIVWSAGGYAWAQEVVDTLQLNDYVDLVIAKPRWYYDDLPSSEWLGLPQYHTYDMDKKDE